MTASSRYWAIIPAAGTGQRMDGGIPKQYLFINNSTIIERSLDCFLKHSKINGVIVALSAEDQHWSQLDVIRNDKIHTVIGGKTRAESVYNAVAYLANTPAEKDDFILVHDAARPCLHYSDLEQLMTQLENEDVGGILASPVNDTLKLENGQGIISKTVCRENMWYALTPQMFRLKHLENALEHCRQKNITITDEASAIETLGLPVKIVKGRRDNIKVTHMEDLELATAILEKLVQ